MTYVPCKIIVYIFENVEFSGGAIGVVHKIPEGAEDLSILYVAMMRKGAASVDDRQVFKKVFNLRILLL